jgi:class 3 adenylate cyclase
MASQTHTFLFADLVDFTRYTQSHGDERAADIATRFQRHVCALASSLGCHVVKTLGDAVMVRSENGEAAIELGARVLDLAARDGLPAVRVGLDTGPAVEREGDWFGSTVNTASRVASAASAGELWMTERAREACARAGGLDVRERGAHRLKGLPVHALYAVA